jgi:hypothetical protein
MRTWTVPVAAVGTFLLAKIAATLLLGNVLGPDSCAAGWTGYVALGSCPH